LTNSFAQLQGAIAKFNTGIESIDVIQKKQEPILVPLTSSLYVPGKLKDPSRIMLDVGTGYLIDQV
jgi:prefoldin alpha subunit